MEEPDGTESPLSIYTRMKRLSTAGTGTGRGSHKPDDEIFSSAEIKNPSIPLLSALRIHYISPAGIKRQGGNIAYKLTIKRKAGVETPGKGRERADWERCRKAREAAGYTQEKLAEAIGRGPQFVSDMERGKCGMSLSTFRSLCSVLSVSADYLLFGWTGGGSLPLSIDERISRLSESERMIVKQQLNLILRAFPLNSDSE